MTTTTEDTGQRELILLSYSRADAGFTLGLAQHLREAGLSVWIDQLDIPPGADWERQIENALQRADTMVVVLSPDSADSGNVRNEIAYALDCDKEVVPVLHERCEPPLSLRRSQYVDFTGDEAKARELLVRALRAPRGAAVAAAAPTRTRPRRGRAWWFVAGASVLAAVAVAIGWNYRTEAPPPSSPNGATTAPSVLSPDIQVRLHGNSPTLSRSPDASRVVTSTLLGAEPFARIDHEGKKAWYAEHAGIFVVDARTGDQTRVGSRTGSHPFWLSDTSLAWIVDGDVKWFMGGEEPGIYTLELADAGASGRRIPVRAAADRRGARTSRELYHALPARRGVADGTPLGDPAVAYPAGHILFYLKTFSDRDPLWGELYRAAHAEDQTFKAGWMAVERHGGQMVKVSDPLRASQGFAFAGGAWRPPTDLVNEQCPQRLEPWSVEIEPREGYVLYGEGGVRIRLSESEPYTYRMKQDCSPNPLTCGPVAACLSPDGKRVAFFTAGEAPEEYVLNIARLPR